MKPKSKAHKKTKNSSSLWKWNANDSKKKNGNQFPVPEFLQESYKKVEETTQGPGGGVGIGCGIGAGFGLVGGLGLARAEEALPFSGSNLVPEGILMGIKSYNGRCRNIIASRFENQVGIEMPALLRLLQKQLQSIKLLKASKRSPLVDLTNMTLTEENIMSMELAIQQR
ncbi:hypothetical protein SADUNF_Sadunf17G0111200 [Salix dunnii]|uniref:Uncharacterized protein n=1 Tax=Salix dunnii TaxID=1413687 RepID=A0A835J3Q8_9ROSI|nr:hypothetical protein SADUNF_Sadunf17G0111200 [Salix dunnii]